jgi:hypothetical protein
MNQYTLRHAFLRMDADALLCDVQQALGKQSPGCMLDDLDPKDVVMRNASAAEAIDALKGRLISLQERLGLEEQSEGGAGREVIALKGEVVDNIGTICDSISDHIATLARKLKVSETRYNYGEISKALLEMNALYSAGAVTQEWVNDARTLIDQAETFLTLIKQDPGLDEACSGLSLSEEGIDSDSVSARHRYDGIDEMVILLREHLMCPILTRASTKKVGHSPDLSKWGGHCH